jgi:NAD(P)-dependent dehydrogenase (short-subunit alcohol dehydrogenase family)
MKYLAVVTGASSGFGRMTSNALARAGHTVYAGIRETKGRNAPQAADVLKYAKDNRVDLRAIELDVGSESSVNAAIDQIISDNDRLDIVVHNAGHMVFGPAETFTPEQLAELYDVNVLSTQRVNRAALPQLRKQGRGLLIWVSSSSSAGGTPPYLSPYFAAKAAMDSLAVQYARELTRWGSKRRSSCPAPSPVARTTSPIPAVPGMRLASPSTNRAPTRVLVSKYRRRLPPSYRRTRIPRWWPTQSLRS